MSLKKFINNVLGKSNAPKKPTSIESLTSDNELHQKTKSSTKNTPPFSYALNSIEESRSIRYLAHKSAKLNFILSCTLLLLTAYSGVVTWYAIHPVKEYFATDRGKIIPLVPLREPHKTVQQVIQFTKDALLDSFSLDFVNYRGKLEESRRYYTEKGFSNFLNALQKSGMLDLVKERRMNLYVTVGTGVLTKRETVNGIYQWEIQIPLTLKPVGQTTEIAQQDLMATIKINRTSVLDTNDGIAINQLVTRPAR